MEINLWFRSAKRFVIIFNGEIYNFKELKKLLKKSGYKSFGGSDTEILLNTISYFGLKKYSSIDSRHVCFCIN